MGNHEGLAHAPMGDHEGLAHAPMGNHEALALRPLGGAAPARGAAQGRQVLSITLTVPTLMFTVTRSGLPSAFMSAPTTATGSGTPR